MTTATSPKPELPDPDGLVRADARIPGGLLAKLAAHGFAADSIERIERQVPTVLGAGRMPLIEMALFGQESTGEAACLWVFAYGMPLLRDKAERGLGAEVVAALVDAGVVRSIRDPRTGEEALKCPWRFMPFGELIIVSDRPEAGSDSVMGPGPTTASLARAALPGAEASALAGTRVLDVGCGAGSLALAALRAGAASAVAIDINPRAIAVAAANAVLNRLPLECRQGDLLAPVAGERFDLVLAQPPYVVHASGTAEVTYLHGGDRGDELARRMLSGIPGILSERGLAFLQFDGPANEGDQLISHLAATANTRVDVGLLIAPGLSPAVQAMAYSSLIDGGFGPGYATGVRAYLAHCRAHGLTAFHHYLAILRRPATGWAAQIPLAPNAHPLRGQVDQLLRDLDLAAADEASLLAAKVGPPATTQVILYRPFGAPLVQRIEIDAAPMPWPPRGEVDENSAALFDLLARHQSVTAAIEEYATECGESVEAARPVVVAFARDGLRRGLLIGSG